MNKIPVEEQLTQETMGKLWDNYHNIGILSQKYLADVHLMCKIGARLWMSRFLDIYMAYALEWG